MTRKSGFGWLVLASFGSAVFGTILVMLLIESLSDSIIENEMTFFALVLGVILASVFIAVNAYNWKLKEKISWGY